MFYVAVCVCFYSSMVGLLSIGGKRGAFVWAVKGKRLVPEAAFLTYIQSCDGSFIMIILRGIKCSNFNTWKLLICWLKG